MSLFGKKFDSEDEIVQILLPETPYGKKVSKKELDRSYEFFKFNAERFLFDCMNLLKTTATPIVFFERFDMLKEWLYKTTVVERYYPIANEPLQPQYVKIIELEDDIINAFLERYYNKLRQKLLSLKTDKAILSNIEKSFLEIENYSDKMSKICLEKNKLYYEELISQFQANDKEYKNLEQSKTEISFDVSKFVHLKICSIAKNLGVKNIMEYDSLRMTEDSRLYEKHLLAIQNKVITYLENKDFEQGVNEIFKGIHLEIPNASGYCSLHFFCNEMEKQVYKHRDENPSLVDVCLKICDFDINLLTTKWNLSGAFMPTITKKCILLEKQNQLGEAINLCDLAIAFNFMDSNKKSFEFRRDRLISKQKQMNSSFVTSISSVPLK